MLQTHTWLGGSALAAAVLALSSTAASANLAEVHFDNWTWEMTVEELPGGPTETVTASGDAIVRFFSPTLDMGTEADPLPVPPGPQGNVDIEIVSMSLTGTGFPGFGGANGEFQVLLGPSTSSAGQIQNLNNVGGVLTGDVFFDLWMTIADPFTGVQLTNDNSPSNTNPQPVGLSMSFDASNGPPEIDVFWMPTFLWFETPPGVPVELWDLTGAPNPWDLVGPVHVGIPGMSWTPEPSLLALFGIGLAGLYSVRKRAHT